MREILFRAKMEDNGQWVLGSFIPDLLEVYQNDPDGWQGDWGFIKPFEKINGSRHMVQVVRETVGQYIGLQDRNGRRIFEGDIIKSPRGPAFLVEYVDDISSFAARARENTRWTPGLNKGTMQGYEVVGADGNEYWTPKETFERFALPVTTNPKLKTDNPSISQEMVDSFILETWTETAGKKTTIVRAMLKNGYEIVEASSCVSPENYDEALGREICMKRIKNKIWGLLGFLLQTATYGVQGINQK